MADVAKTVVHTSSQLLLGVASGSLIDAVFPAAGDELGASNATEAGMLAAEAALQLTANGLLTVVVVKALNSLASVGLDDPSNGTAYLFGLFESQPTLRLKIERLSLYLRALLVPSAMSSSRSMIDGWARSKKFNAAALTDLKTDIALGTRPSQSK